LRLVVDLLALRAVYRQVGREGGREGGVGGLTAKDGRGEKECLYFSLKHVQLSSSIEKKEVGVGGGGGGGGGRVQREETGNE